MIVRTSDFRSAIQGRERPVRRANSPSEVSWLLPNRTTRWASSNWAMTLSIRVGMAARWISISGVEWE